MGRPESANHGSTKNKSKSFQASRRAGRAVRKREQQGAGRTRRSGAVPAGLHWSSQLPVCRRAALQGSGLGQRMAATNKCLARSNKSRTGVPATNKRRQRGAIPLGAANWRVPVAGSQRCRSFETLNGMQDLQGDLPTFFVVIIAAAAFLAGLCGERLRAKLARQAWQKRRWRRGEGGVPFKTGAAPVTDPAEQLRLVMGARFEKRRLLSRSEAHVLYAAERAINTADLKWRVMAQVSLGEVLSSPDARAYSAINSKRVDLLIVSRSGDPIAAIEYQGHGHYQGTAAARDAVKKEALRKAGVRYIAVTPESGTEDMAREISRIAQAERLSPILPLVTATGKRRAKNAGH